MQGGRRPTSKAQSPLSAADREILMKHFFYALTAIVMTAAAAAAQQSNSASAANTNSRAAQPQAGVSVLAQRRAAQARNENVGATNTGSGNANTNAGATHSGAAPIQGRPSIWKRIFSDPFAIVAILGLIVYMYRARLKGSDKHTTNAHLATGKELEATYSSNWGDGGALIGIEMKPTVLGKPMKGQPLRLPLERRFNHVMIEAGSGAGKTTSYIIPQMYEDADSARVNVFTVDRKSPEQYFEIAKAWLDRGHRVLLFDPWQSSLTSGFEPLWGATHDQLEAMVEVHISLELDPNSPIKLWRDIESRILRVAFHAAQAHGRCQGPGPGVNCKCQHSAQAHGDGEVGRCDCPCRRHFCTLPAVAQILTYGWEATRAFIESGRPDLNLELADLWRIPSGNLNQLFVGLATKLELYRQPGPSAAFTRSDFTISDVVTPIGTRQKRRALLIIGASQSYGVHAKLVASLLTQLLSREVYLRRNAMALEGLKGTDEAVVPLIVYLDEFPTYAVPEADDFIATARSAGVSIVVALQNRQQLTEHYGVNAVPRMVTNFGTQIVLRGVHPEVAKEISDSSGKIIQYDEVDSAGATGGFAKGRSYSRTKQRRPVEVPLIRPDDILNLPTSQAFVLGPTAPAKVYTVRYYENEVLLRGVVASASEMREFARANLRADEERRPRNPGQPRRLQPAKFHWIAIPAIHEVLSRKPGDDKDASDQHKRIIAAKLRDLNLEPQRDKLALQVCKRRVEQFTKADAATFIDYLKSLEAIRQEATAQDDVIRELKQTA